MYVIHYWIFRAPPRKIHLWSFCARARRIHLWIYRAQARKRFSSLYRKEKFSALGRGESTFGSTAPERGNDFLLYTREKIFCARARRIHLWIYRARARKRFFLYIGEKNFLRSGAENPPLDLPRPDFLRSGAENPYLDLPRPGAETIFSLYRGEKFLRSGAENPPLDLPRPDFLRPGAENPHLDLPRPSAETIFFSI